MMNPSEPRGQVNGQAYTRLIRRASVQNDSASDLSAWAQLYPDNKLNMNCYSNDAPHTDINTK